MNILIVLVALSGQFRYSGDVGSPPARESAAVAEPFPARALPVELRAPAPNVLPLPADVFAPEPLPALPAEVFAPPRRRIIRVAGQDAPAPNPSPTPGIRRPEAEEALLQRLADVEHRVDELERARAVTASGVAQPPVVKGWRGIVGEPGVEGFGALNAKGEIVVERRRVTVQPAPVFATYPEPVTYQAPPVIYGTPYGAPLGGFGVGSVCGPGGCGPASRGLFGGLFR